MIFTKKNKQTELDREIEVVIQYLGTVSPDEEGYGVIAENLEKLYKIRNDGKFNKVKPDTIVLALTNLLGIALILGYERTEIIRSKALGFVIKGRV